MYRSLVFPILSRLEPERAHALALKSMRAAGRVPGALRALRAFAGPKDPRLEVRAFGLTFPNPLGAAAGLDKNADAVPALLALGFGAVEVGTVTPRPQSGNPAPRVWRLPEARALVNALGFPSSGAAAVKKRLAGKRFQGILGVNLGKNKDTPAEKAPEDYAAVFSSLRDELKYAVVNVSSPNTPGLRDLQNRQSLVNILAAVEAVNPARKPVLVKLSPDLDDAQLDDALAGALEGGASGLVVTNTTLEKGELAKKYPGGLSGEPLRDRSLAMLQKARKRIGKRLPLIGVGGIATAEDALARMRAGASLVQLYTSFVYGGPGLPGQVVRGIFEHVVKEKLRSVEELVGSAT